MHGDGCERRDSIALPGVVASYHHNNTGTSNMNMHPSVFKNLFSSSSVGFSDGGGSTFHVENPSPMFPVTEIKKKKKRGRPRKYRPDDGTNMSLGYLSPLSAPQSSSREVDLDSGEKARRGRPPGTGWKQKLAPLGEWMNSSAGQAFAPHVLHVRVGEDVAEKILAFAQQRPRALCVMSATGSVSAVTLRQPTTSGSSVTYQGRFEILCLSGSYLVAESGGPHSRTGGISISVCSPDGHILGGAIGGKLIAANPVQVVACSFVYGGTKAKNKDEYEKEDKHSVEQSAEKSATPVNAAPLNQGFTPSSSNASVWPSAPPLRPSGLEANLKISDIDLKQG